MTLIRSHVRKVARGRRGVGMRLLLIGLAVVVVAGMAITPFVRGRLTTGAPEPNALLYDVKRGDLVVTITEDGSIESSRNTDLKCEVAGGSTILSLIPDGTQVSEGDELVRLDSAVIEETINTQKIAFEKAQALQIQSAAEFKAAEIAVQEYLEGTYVQALQTCEANIQIAMENLRSSQNTLGHTIKMARKGYVTGLQREAQAFAVERAKLDLKNAETAKSVLVKFTKPKMMGDLESKRDTAAAKMRSDEAAFNLEEQKLKRLTTQLEKCVIVAPQDGMVIYANEYGWRGNQERQIEEGAAVRERQSLIRLPDLTSMQAKALVHESKIDLIQLGMRARVTVQDQEYQGEITYIANQAEPPSPFSPSVKRYSTIVKIDGRSTGLRPGMTAEVEILAANLTGVLTVPEQAVVEIGGEYFCYVPGASEPQARKVELGLSDGTHIEIKSGLQERDRVYQNPRKFATNAHSISSDDEHVDVTKRFGSSSLPRPAGADAQRGLRAQPGADPRGPRAEAPAGVPGEDSHSGRPGGPGMRGPRTGGPGGADAATGPTGDPGAGDRGPRERGGRRRGADDAGPGGPRGNGAGGPGRGA
jgi:HlyD family secretion protein